MLIQGPKIQTRIVQVMTRVGPSKLIRYPRPQPGHMALGPDILIYAIGFEHVAGPGRNAEGGVVDAATGQPVPGVVIRPKMVYPGAFDNPYPLIRWRSEMSTRAVTDVRGHYRLGGLPVGHPVELGTGLGDRMPYRPMFQKLPNCAGHRDRQARLQTRAAEFRCREGSRTERPASPSRPSSNTCPRSRTRT